MKLVGQGWDSLGGLMVRLTAERQPKAIRADSTARWVETAPFGCPVVPDE